MHMVIVWLIWSVNAVCSLGLIYLFHLNPLNQTMSDKTPSHVASLFKNAIATHPMNERCSQNSKHLYLVCKVGRKSNLEENVYRTLPIASPTNLPLLSDFVSWASIRLAFTSPLLDTAPIE
ncbi:hypothetical protein ACQKWADRAFT_41271 [Trichoderma austrokoningii]